MFLSFRDVGTPKCPHVELDTVSPVIGGGIGHLEFMLKWHNDSTPQS